MTAYLKRLEPLALVIMFLGGLNWGILGVFNENVLGDIFGNGTLLDVVYAIVGVAALVYVPRVMALVAEFEPPHLPRMHGA